MKDIKNVRICGLSDVGQSRSRNEDAFLIGNVVERTGFVSMGFDLKSLAGNEQGFLVAAADGMGGLSGGDVASRLALNIFSRHYYARTYLNTPADQVMETIRDSILAAHRILQEASSQKPEYRNMGTTLVGLNIVGGKFFRFHAGDSRLYRLRNSRLQQITKDHSLVQILLDTGKLKPDQVEGFARKNEITNTLGAGTACRPEIVQMLDVASGDLLILCSDGLFNMLDFFETPPKYKMLMQLLDQIKSREGELVQCSDKLFNELEGLKARLGPQTELPLQPVKNVPQIDGYDETQEYIISDLDTELPPLPSETGFELNHFLSYLQGWQQKLELFLSEEQKNPLTEILNQPIDLEEKTHLLIKRANERTSKDNVTVVMIEVN